MTNNPSIFISLMVLIIDDKSCVLRSLETDISYKSHGTMKFFDSCSPAEMAEWFPVSNYLIICAAGVRMSGSVLNTQTAISFVLKCFSSTTFEEAHKTLSESKLLVEMSHSDKR